MAAVCAALLNWVVGRSLTLSRWTSFAELSPIAAENAHTVIKGNALVCVTGQEIYELNGIV